MTRRVQVNRAAWTRRQQCAVCGRKIMFRLPEGWRHVNGWPANRGPHKAVFGGRKRWTT